MIELVYSYIFEYSFSNFSIFATLSVSIYTLAAYSPAILAKFKYSYIAPVDIIDSKNAFAAALVALVATISETLILVLLYTFID